MDNNLMPPPNMMPPPNLAPKRGTPKGAKKDEGEKPEAHEEKQNVEKTVEAATSDTAEKTETTQEKEAKGKEPEKEKEKWKAPENVELLYTPPEWSSAPKYNFSIDVLKNGTIVENIDLTKKEHFLIGRLPICDISFDHPSVSRQHAVIQNRDTGALYIYDLGSTHRTTVNKRPIPPKVHYVIRIGDVIKFGQSTRQFIVGGPADVEQEQREAVERQRAEFLRKKLEDQVQIKTYTPLIDLFAKKGGPSTIASMRGDSASWGMDFDDDAVYAADNPEEEVFMGNEDDAEAYIKKGKKDAKRDAGQYKRSQNNYDDDDSNSDDDEFFDRTLQKKDGGLAKVETYDSLVAKKEELTKKKEDLNAELRAVKSSASSASNAEDSLDAFMNSNAESIVGDKKKRILAKIADVEKEQARVDRLIKLAAPALKPTAPPKKPVEKPVEKVPEKSAEKSSEKSQAPAPGAKPAEKKKTSRPLQLLDAEIPEEYRVKEPLKDEKEEQKDKKEENSEDNEGDKADKSIKIAEKGEQGEKTEKETKGEGEEGEGKEDDGEKGGKSRTAIKRDRQREKKKEREEDEKKRQRLEQYESKYDAWVPPKAQSGDGRTKLNDLYGY